MWLQFVAEINTRENLVRLTDHYYFIIKFFMKSMIFLPEMTIKLRLKNSKERKPVILSRIYSVFYIVIYQEKSYFV